MGHMLSPLLSRRSTIHPHGRAAAIWSTSPLLTAM